MKKIIFTTLTVLLYSTAFAMGNVVPWAQRVRECASSTTVAAGALIFAKDGNDVYVLLGHRDDQDSWCNPGGMAEDTDAFSWITAVREVKEETMGFYVFPPEQLKGFPSHCLYIHDKNIVYTMYLAEVNKVPIEKINERLAESTGSSKEYREFRWVVLKDLLDFCNDCQASLKLMDEFCLMLKQAPILDQLHVLIGGGEITREVVLHTCSSSVEGSTFNFEENEQEADSAVIKNFINQQKLFLNEPQTDEKQSTKTSLNNEISSLKLECFSAEERAAVINATLAEFDNWNSDPLSPTQAYLKLILDNKYNSCNSRDALKENLSIFIKEILPTQCSLGKETSVDLEGIEKLADILEFELEEYKHGRPVVYHGLDGSILSFYQYIASLHSLLKGERMDTFGGLRGIHIPFINQNTGCVYKNIFEVFDVLGRGDYSKERNRLLMCVNPILVLGPGDFSNSISSSVEYFINSHSVNAPSVENLMLETLLLLGMPHEIAQQCYEEWYSLYQQFYCFRGSKKNGGLLAISMPLDLSRTHTLVTYTGGSPDIGAPSIIQMIKNVQVRANNRSMLTKNIIKNLTNEARIYLDPTKQFKVEGKFHYDLTEQQNKLFAQYWDIMITTHLSRLLQAKTEPIKNSLIICNSDRYLIKSVSEIFQLSQPANILCFLIEKGWIGAIESYLDLFKDSLNNDSDKIKHALWKAIVDNGQYEVIKTLDKYYTKLSPSMRLRDLFSTEEKRLIAFNVCELNVSYNDLANNLDEVAANVENISDFLGEIFTFEQKEQVFLSLLKSYRRYYDDSSKISTVFDKLGLDTATLFDKVFSRILSENKFACVDVYALEYCIDMGVFASTDDKRKLQIKQLLSAEPNNWNSIDSYNYWLFSLRFIKKTQRYLQDYIFYYHGDLYYKTIICLGLCSKYPVDQCFVDMLSELVINNFSKNGFLNWTSICYDTACQNQLQENVLQRLSRSLAETRPYSCNVIRKFFGNKKYWRILRRPNSGEKKLTKFAATLRDSKNFQQIITAIDEIDDIGILFLNLNLMDDIFSKMQQGLSSGQVTSQCIYDNDIMELFDQFQKINILDKKQVQLFTDDFFLKILKREKKYSYNVLEVIKNEEVKILEFSKTAPVYVMKHFIDLLLSKKRNISYIEALLTTLKRVLAFNSHLFYEPIDELTIDGDLNTFADENLLEITINAAIALYQYDKEKYKGFLKDFCSISAVQEKLINGENAAGIILDICYAEGSNDCDTFFSLFPNKAEAFRTTLKNSNMNDKFSLIYMAFEHNHIEYNEIFIEFFNQEIPRASLKNRDNVKLVNNNLCLFKQLVDAFPRKPVE